MTEFVCFISGAVFGYAVTIIYGLKRTNVLELRIDRALKKLTPKSAHIGKQMAAILRGVA